MSRPASQGGPPSATVAIVTKDRCGVLRNALASALAQQGDVEVLVVDDGSRDGTAEMVREEFPGVRVQRFEASAGLVVRRNFAVRAAAAPIVISIDDDAVFSATDIVAQTLRDFDHPRIAVVAIPYIDVGADDVVRQRAPDDHGRWVAATFRGTAYAVRRDPFLALGGFRESIFHQGEEPDLSLRMLDAGWLVRQGRAAPIHHFASPNRSVRRMDVYGRRNEILLCFTLLPFPSDVLVAGGYALKGLRLGWRLGRPGAMLEGMGLGLRDSWRLRAERRPVRRRTVLLDRRLRRAGSLPLDRVERSLPPLGTEMTPPRDLPIVVVGGYEYSPDMNQPATVTVRELARRHRVLNLHSEAHGSLLRRLQGRARQLSLADTVRTAVGPTRVRRVEERLWLAPVRGLAAIGPLSAPEALRRRNARVFGSLIRRWLADIGARECVLLFYWWALPELVDEVPHAASIYDCTDDHAALPGAIVPAATVARLEGRLLDGVDRSYVVSSGLLEGRAGPGRRIGVLPNGFDVSLFRQIQRAGFTAPGELVGCPRPVVGYAGGINRRLDWELLTALSRRRPEWTFAFVGGDARHAPAELRRTGNVVFLRPLPYPQALAAMTRFDVATIPARVSDFSRGNSFLKLLDYFAHGTPVVATPLPATTEVARAEVGLLWLAEDVEGWLAALTAALAESPSSPARAARRRFVEARSVSRRVARMLAEALGDGSAQPAGDPWASGAPASSAYRAS